MLERLEVAMAFRHLAAHLVYRILSAEPTQNKVDTDFEKFQTTNCVSLIDRLLLTFD